MKNKLQHLTKGAFVLMAMVCGSGLAHGQNYDSIAVKYKDENAVITNYTRRMVISFEDGKPVGKTYVSEEKLLISDLAPSMFKSEGFAHSSSFSEMDDFYAWTYTPGKTGYKKERCTAIGDVRSERDYVFYDDSWVRAVHFSGLVKKSRTEVKYTLLHNDGHMLPGCVFQQNLPIVKEVFEVVAPKYVTMNFALKGENTNWIKQTKEEANGMVTYTFTANDVPAAKEMAGVPSFRYYLPHIIPYITSYKRYNEDKPKEWLANTDELYKYVYKNVSHVNLVEDTSLNKIAKEITKNDKTDREKAAHIYKWVQKNMHYIAFEDGLEGFVPREAKVVCNRKYGDCKDMTSIMVAMCRKVGIDAYFTWIGTTELPYTYEETPLPSVDNHMICAAKIDGEWVFIDGTHPELPFGVNRDDVQGKEAMIAIDAKNYKIVTMPELPAEKNVTTDSTLLSMDEYNVKGSVRISYKGYPAWNTGVALQRYNSEDREKFVKGLIARGTNKLQQVRYTADITDSVNKDIRITADFTIDNYVNNAGKQYYVNMNLNREFDNNHIKTEDRTVPYYLDYKEKTKEVVVLEIPKGYRITYVPPAAHGKVDGLWSYNITYTVARDKKSITLVKEYEVNTRMIDQKKFAENNKLVASVKKAYKESVVLTATKNVNTASRQ